MCPCLTPARNLRRKPFHLVFLRYFSGVFWPVFPREIIKGFKVLGQLPNTSKCFPTLSLHCRFLVVSTLWSSPSQREMLHWPKYKMRLFWGATRIAQLTLHWAGCRMQDVAGLLSPAKSPISTQGKWHSSVEFHMVQVSKSMFNLGQCLLLGSAWESQ